MIDLYKANEELKARAKLLYDFREVKVNEAKEAWLKEQRVAYELAYPSFEVVTDAELVETIVTIEQAVSFDEWLNETYVVKAAVEATETTEAVAEVVELVREFVAPEVTEDMLDAYLNTNDGYLKYLKSESNKIIESMTVTISSGKEFDANELARVNMMSAVISSEFAGLTETSWRLANNETTVVTLNELKEAVMLALVKFGQLRGIV